MAKDDRNLSNTERHNRYATASPLSQEFYAGECHELLFAIIAAVKVHLTSKNRIVRLVHCRDNRD